MSVKPEESRRRFLGAAVAAGLWPVAAQAQRITTNTPPGVSSADQDAASLKARTDAADLLTVAVLVNGRGPFNFVVDTGAERSVLCNEVAATLNLAHGETVTIEGIATAIPVATVHADAIGFGPFVRKDVLMPLLPRSTLAADGYLGLDAINGTRVTFDFKHHQLHIEQPKAIFDAGRVNDLRVQQPSGVQAPRLSETWIAAHGKAGRLQIADCLVGGIPAVAFVDTGAEISVGNPALLKALKTFHQSVPDLGSIILTGVTGGQLAGEVISVDRINVQDLTFSESFLAIADAPDFTTWGLRDKPAVLIGMNYLRQFASVTVDYRAKAIRFELSEAPPLPRPEVAITARA